LTEVRGIPDKSAVPSVFVNYQTVAVIQPPVGIGAADTWSFNLNILPHPVQFAYVAISDTGGHSALQGVLNAQLDGATHALKYATLLTTAQRWRLAYMGATVYQDAPALADQGTIVGDQAPLSAPLFACSVRNAAGGVCHHPVGVWDQADEASYTRSQSMPNAYFSRSKEGLYMPLKLTRTCQNWSSQANSVMRCGFGDVLGSDLVLPNVADAAGTAFPFTGIFKPYWDPATNAGGGTTTAGMMSDVIGHVCAQNLAPTTTYSVFFRVGIEMQVSPGTVLSPHLRLSPRHDKKALDTYFAICRELKDAYPADYNSESKLWSVIKGVIESGVIPAVSMIPGVGPIMGMLGKAGVMVGDKIDEAVQARAARAVDSGRSTGGSMGDIEVARAVVQSRPVVRQGGVAFSVPGPQSTSVSRGSKPSRRARSRTRSASTPRRRSRSASARR